MKKILSVSLLLLGLSFAGSTAWADSYVYYHDDGHETFKKIVHILDDIVNDDYKHKQVVVVKDKPYYSHRRAQHHHHYYGCGCKNQYKKYSKHHHKYKKYRNYPKYCHLHW